MCVCCDIRICVCSVKKILFFNAYTMFYLRSNMRLSYTHPIYGYIIYHIYIISYHMYIICTFEYTYIKPPVFLVPNPPSIFFLPSEPSYPQSPRTPSEPSYPQSPRTLRALVPSEPSYPRTLRALVPSYPQSPLNLRALRALHQIIFSIS